jgi:surfactin synthase thioesterase subunit
MQEGRFNLFFLPFAGGSRFSYRVFEENATPLFKVIPIEYPGRGSRASETLLTDTSAIVEDAYIQIKDKIGNQRYAIYGHSMGGIVAWLLSRKIVEKKLPLPEHLFISGTPGPASESRKQDNWHLLDKKEFIQRIIELNGCSSEVLENPELLEYFEPILRADFQAIESFSFKPVPPLPISLTIITGTEEAISLEDIYLWKQETEKTASFRQLKGGHFFIYEHVKAIISIIRESVNPL